jgi:hypothetical protein
LGNGHLFVKEIGISMNENRFLLWLRWTLANGLAELVGLGSTFAAIGLLISRIDTGHISGILLAFGLTVASGAIEATLVGLAQWWAMHPWFPGIRRFAWWRATLVGALLGYTLGYLPSTLMSMADTTTQAAQAEPPQWVTLLLAAGLGAAAGAVLSFAQWLVLRGKARRAGSWIPANMLAWACGMPVIFWGMDLATVGARYISPLLMIGAAILAAGLLVGAIHGAFLVRMRAKAS